MILPLRLLNEMDGLGPDARVLFVLTTNRAEVLEPALAGRPGRIDQVSPRRRSRSLSSFPRKREPMLFHALLSPAFIKELDRRAAQATLERGGNALGMEDFERALGDMVRSGGKLSARLAGAEGAVGFV